jgi:acetolactate decarboxylase
LRSVFVWVSGIGFGLQPGFNARFLLILRTAWNGIIPDYPLISGKVFFQLTCQSMEMKCILFCVLFFSSTGYAQQQPEVSYFGELRKVMQEGDLSAVVSLDTMGIDVKTYGLGVAANLEGEIIVVEGKCYRSMIENGEVVTQEGASAAASMVVFSEMESFKTITETASINSLKELAARVQPIANANRIDGNMPFPFLLKITKGKVNYHIINWQQGVPHTPSNHKQFAKFGVFKDEEVLIVGFYSRQHAGIFTQHGSALHLHVINKSRSIVGHVDSLELTNGCQILLP